ncbi:MAG: transposase, partial [Ruthenibacterium sp.]
MKNKQKNTTNTDDIITISRSEYETLQSKIAEQNNQLDWLMEQLRLSKKKQFGASSERLEEGLVEQLSLTFNETEAYQPKDESPATIVKSYERKSRSGSVDDVVPDDAPVKVIEHRLSEEERVCAQC